MPRLAMALSLVWFGALFVFRTWVQWRRTGSTGIKGFHGAVGSLEWWAGLSVGLSFVLALLAPVVALLGWPGGGLLFSHAPLHGLGAALVLIGVAGGLAAQLAMGDSWRIGVDASDRTALVTGGLYAQVRNPIYSFMGLSLVGLILLLPTVLVLVTALLMAGGIELQVRVVEEPHLLRTHGDTYARYAARVGRFAPGIGRWVKR